jgi:hypothetical protein
MHNFSHEIFSKSGSSLLKPHADPTALTTQIWGEKINSEREERKPEHLEHQIPVVWTSELRESF